ncbi:site-specific tyrosine recombinase XerD [Planctomycetes bacterium Poly30]|uniref:Site-specific tyrosine recombinase XerD n=1 Tax=Saltatorellus ferox TaxID=2528018 RepID=A0A518ET71_9BACT|nr:site-specific tyrosine recombinase XerD [Planctomycetes bacterium Poly30]
MRVFRKYRKGPRGAQVPCKKWYVEFRDHREVVHRLAAFTDKAASTELGRKVERLASLRSAGEPPDAELSRFIASIPDRLRERLGEIDLIDRSRMAGSRPIDAIVDEYAATLLARERTPKYVSKVRKRVERVLEGIRAQTLLEFHPAKVEMFLASLRGDGLAMRTSNHYLASVSGFTAWAVVQGYVTEDPLTTVKPVNARMDPRRERRALSFDDELPRLIQAAANGPEHRGVSGPLRALVYRLAAETGLRVAELVSLRTADLDFDSERPTLLLRASSAKNRREARIALRPTTVQELLPHLRDRLPSAPALALPKSFKDKATRWLKFDLEAAEIPYVDDSERVADFHALRASFVSGLMKTGANPRTVQSMARHSSAEMTLGIYSKLGRDDERDALALLPDLPSTCKEDEVMRATGTDDAGTGKSGPQNGPFQGASTCTSMQLAAPLNGPEGSETGGQPAVDGGGGGSRTPVPESELIQASTCVSHRQRSRVEAARGHVASTPASEMSRHAALRRSFVTSPLNGVPAEPRALSAATGRSSCQCVVVVGK